MHGENVELYANALNQLKDAIIIMDNDFRIVYQNKATEEYFDVDSNEALGSKLTELLQFRWLRAEYEQAVRAPLEEESKQRSENIHIRKNGDRIHTESTVSVLKDSSGQKIGMLAVIRDITERKIIEEALRKSEEHYRSLITNMTSGFAYHKVLYDGDGKAADYVFLEVNEAFERLTGIGRKKVIGRRITDVFPSIEKDPADWIGTFGKVSTTGEAIRFNKHSELLNSWYSVSAFSPEKGYFVTIFEDITDLKQAKETLQKERNMLNGIMESTNVMLAYFDNEFNFLVVNPAYAKASGYSVEELIGKNHFALFPNEENEDIFEQVRDTGKAVEYRDKPFEYAYQPERGVTYWDWLLSPVKDGIGHLQGLVLSLCETTQRKKAEDALRESEDRYRAAVMGSNDGIWDLDLRTGKVFYSDRWKSMLGYEPHEITNDLQEFDRLIHPEDRDKARATLEAHLNGESPHFVTEFRMRHKDGSWLWILSRGIAILDKNGKPYRIAGSHTDITARKKMEEALKLHVKRLEELVEERTKKLRETDRFTTIGETAGMVGHDIRNPLQVIVGAIFLAKEELKLLSPENKEKRGIQESLEMIEEQVVYIDKIVTDLENFAKTPKINVKETDIQQLIKDSLSLNKVPENVQVSILVENDFPRLMVDPLLIKRVLFNLILNALQAMPNGGRLTIRASRKEGAALVDIEDTGVGILEKHKSNIFDPLFTTKPKGQGFGLPVSKRIVEAHNGAINFESEVGKGSKFTVKIPLRKKGE